MFHFPTFPPHALCVQARVTPHDWCGVPPFGNPRINARLTAPRGLSQPPTSFIGSWCPGIHRVPLTTWPHKNPAPCPRKETRSGPTQTLCYKSQKMLASTVQFSTYDQSPPAPTPPDPRHPQASQRYETQAAPTEETVPPDSVVRAPVPSGPNSVPTTSPPLPPRSPPASPKR